MASRVGRLALVVVIAFLAVGASSATGKAEGRTAVYLVRVDPRLCPSPRCGGYFVALANGARTRCADGLHQRQCYIARATDARGSPLGTIADTSLVRGAIDLGRDDLGALRVSALYTPAGSAPASGGFYRVRDTGLRCVRAPCFSYVATQVNGSTRTRVSGVDLAAAKGTASERARGEAALFVTGVYTRGRFARGDDGGPVFRATRLYLKAPLPRA